MLYLWMPEASQAWQWSVGGKWYEAASIEALIQAIQPYRDTDTTVFFPSRAIQIIQQDMSKAQFHKLGADGVQYLLEEFVTIPIDSMRVVHYFKSPHQLFVMGIAQQTLQHFVHLLALLPVKIVGLLPDFLILPVPEPNQVVIAEISGRLLIRENEYQGSSCDDLSLYLDFQDQAQQQQYKIMGLQQTEQQILSALITQERLESVDYVFYTPKKPQQHPWNVWPKVASHQAISGYWKACIALVFTLVFIQLGYDALRWFKFNQLANQTAAQALMQYQQWFGENARVNEQNLASQFESQLRSAKIADQSAIQLLSQVGPMLMQRKMIADQVEYDASILSLRLKAADTDSFNQFSQQLKQQGLKVELGDIQPDGQGVIAMVKIQS
ncbi:MULTISPECIES: type II secretion system protein GspL [unclassified Acinetobacter]|uniref:type II secretion system protein GspL n=1 Tax=unclassified Acinetobacter TaxID=196816 RepID=UPI002934262D|nr:MULTISPECIES: type II secretion system protein GspL [unclassified Acinetobacter]WOE33213.1 type II secretion system protein GspL [Acinetobacter sp. SAAs470]WOE37180.1 type II secretion system protein GspL [Acinetobacter sp. SAAs474]